MPGDKTFFNIDWINPDLYPYHTWLEPVKDSPNEAFCKKCPKKFMLSNMGIQAIKSHEKNKKHIKLTSNSHNISDIFKAKATTFCPSLEKSVSTNVSHTENLNDLDSQNASSNSAHISTLNTCIIKKEVTTAEILWALRIIINSGSYNSCKDDTLLFKRMFTDSSIAKNFALGPDKASYLINYGLAPYFYTLLENELQKCDAFVICFDEALNKISQQAQMDIHVRFWSNSNQKVVTRYLNSAFMTNCSAENILAKFLEILKPFSIYKIFQISMDGPAVNWKFFNLLKSHLEQNENSPSMLNIGSCGLHVVHGAFQMAHKKVGWQVIQFLRGIYYLFKDSPARRAEYSQISGSNVYPLKFCQIRWLGNVQCAERAIFIFENVKKYIEKSSGLSSTGVSLKNIKDCMKNPLMLAQIAFFKLIAEEFQPFLTRFQSPEPLSPYLYATLFELTKNLLRRCVKKSTIEGVKTAKKLAAIDLNNKENFLNTRDIDIGFAANKYLNKSKATEKEKMYFKIDCRNFIVHMISKIFERSPLGYDLTRAISCLSPDLIVRNPCIAQQRMSRCLTILHENNWITEFTAEKTKKEFLQFCDFASTEKKSFLEFDPKKQRLDSFYFLLLNDEEKFLNLWHVSKKLLILSHGNATVEGGFSLNKNLLLENLLEESLISQRYVQDFVLSIGGIQNIQISEKMIQAVKLSRTRWSLALEEKKKEK